MKFDANFTAAGLNATESKTYRTLLEKPEWKPAKLALRLGETRTNMYKVLDSLVELGLAERFDKSKKLHYRAKNPTALLELAHKRKQEQEQAEQTLAVDVQRLLTDYVATHVQPGIRYYHGAEELKHIYLDQIAAKQPIYIIRPDYNTDIYDFDYMNELRHMARKAGIRRYAITPDRPKAPANYKESDAFMLLTRTWIPPQDYTAPVEWNIYGNKLAILSFGNEVMGTVIESPQIAEAFRQLYRIMETGLRRDPEYSSMPKYARYTGDTN